MCRQMKMEIERRHRRRIENDTHRKTDQKINCDKSTVCVGDVRDVLGRVSVSQATATVATGCKTSRCGKNSSINVDEKRRSPGPPFGPNLKATTPEGWKQRIKKLASLARRNPKIFFRRAKADFLIPMKPSQVPVRVYQIEMMMNVRNPWDATVLSFVDEHEERRIPVPTDAESRQWARVSRCKAPGPDNVRPYLYDVLPDNVFHWVCDIVRAITRGELRLDILRETVVFPLSKGGEALSVSNAWRPIGITSALYRIVIRCIQSYLETTIEPSLSERQCAGRKGGFCARATMDLQQLLGSKMMTGNGAYIAFVDVSNAFSSVPIPLLIDALLKYGVSAQVRDLFSYVLYHSVNYVYNTVTGKWDGFLATSGVKQGCATGPITFCAVMRFSDSGVIRARC